MWIVAKLLALKGYTSRYLLTERDQAKVCLISSLVFLKLVPERIVGYPEVILEADFNKNTLKHARNSGREKSRTARNLSL